MPDSPQYFTVTDLKQYQYCARIAYYHACLPDIRPVTLKMQYGIKRHEDEHKRSVRRTLNLPTIDNAERLFDVPLQSEALGLSGQVDELIIFDDHIIPVDYKLAKKAARQYKVQLCAYAMMAEETYGLPVVRGILYLIRQRKSVEVNISRHWRKQVEIALSHMQQIAHSEAIPPPTDNRKACYDCEFRRFCNDI